MLKNILKLEGTQKLSKKEQKNIKGGTLGRCLVGGTWISVECDELCPNKTQPICAQV